MSRSVARGRGEGGRAGPEVPRRRGAGALPTPPPLPTQLRRCNTLPSSSHGGQGQERGPRGSIGFRRAVWRTHTQVVVRGQGGLGLPGIMRVAGVWEGSSRERRSQCRRHARELPEGMIDRSMWGPAPLALMLVRATTARTGGVWSCRDAPRLDIVEILLDASSQPPSRSQHCLIML